MSRGSRERSAAALAAGTEAGPEAGAEAGNAIVEFVFLAILAMIPLLYLAVAVFEVERNTFAVTQAAREAGRAYATAPTAGQAEARARYATELALRDQGLDVDTVVIRYVQVSTICPAHGDVAGGGSASLEPGSDFAVCVTRTVRLPGIPGILDAGRNRVTGRFVVHVDRFRDAR